MNSPLGNPSPQDRAQGALARLAYAEEFSRRQRHRKGWVKAAAVALFAVAVVPAVWATFTRDWRVGLFWLVPAGLGLVLLQWLLRYSKGSPSCPHCHEDITNCHAAYCQLCGEALKTGICARCGVDQSWTAGFHSLALREPIRYCPGCGVYLNTTFYRYEHDRD
jgi:hypothetical protein